MADEQVDAMALAAEETNEMTWAFTQAGRVVIGGRQPQHHDACIKGPVTVQG